jgi:hypothetical protein
MTVQRRLPFELDKHFAIVTNLPDRKAAAARSDRAPAGRRGAPQARDAARLALGHGPPMVAAA